MKRAMQCPGCFAVMMVEQPDSDHYIECETCGEAPTVVDLRDREPNPKDPVERGEIEAAFLEQAELYRREAAEERERGAQGGWEKLTAAAEVVACVTRIVFDTPEDIRRRVNASIDDPDSPGWSAIRAADRARLNQTTSSPKDGGGGRAEGESLASNSPSGPASTSSTKDTETSAGRDRQVRGAGSADPTEHARAPQGQEICPLGEGELHGGDATGPPADRLCPDGGTCHHVCQPGECWRVHNAEPLSGYGDEWPPEIRRASATRSLPSQPGGER